MKKIWVLALVAVMVFSLAACGKEIEVLDGDGMTAPVDSSSEAVESSSQSAEPGDGEDAADAGAARVENERLSGIEPPEGWLLGEAMSENQLIYLFKHDLYDEYPQDAPQLTVDVDEYDSPEEKLAGTQALSEEWEEEYETGEVTIGGVSFLTFDSQSQNFTGLFGAKDGVTLSISVSTRLEIDSPEVIAIISSLRVAPE